jgi:hypothetical protein
MYLTDFTGTQKYLHQTLQTSLYFIILDIVDKFSSNFTNHPQPDALILSLE